MQNFCVDRFVVIQGRARIVIRAGNLVWKKLAGTRGAGQGHPFPVGTRSTLAASRLARAY
jgi:hypothetical protein